MAPDVDAEVPAWQGVHVALPLPLEKLPGWHLLHELWPLEEKKPGVHDTHSWAPICEDDFPAGQTLHVSLEVASVAVENFPKPHLVQTVSPLEVEYDPVPHAGQVTAPDDDDNFPAEQASHVVAPALGLCLPALHLEHVVWSVRFEYVPAMHWEQVLAADDDPVEDPAGQVWHVVNAALALYLPAWHLLHELWPLKAEYHPASQS